MNDKTTILVVEDKDNEREAMARLLRMENYSVISAERKIILYYSAQICEFICV